MLNIILSNKSDRLEVLLLCLILFRRNQEKMVSDPLRL